MNWKTKGIEIDFLLLTDQIYKFAQKNSFIFPHYFDQFSQITWQIYATTIASNISLFERAVLKLTVQHDFRYYINYHVHDWQDNKTKYKY